MARALKPRAREGSDFPATARLRAELLIAPDLETLVSLFAQALAEHGIDGHFCLRKSGSGLIPLVGDSVRESTNLFDVVMDDFTGGALAGSITRATVVIVYDD